MKRFFVLVLQLFVKRRFKFLATISSQVKLRNQNIGGQTNKTEKKNEINCQKNYKYTFENPRFGRKRRIKRQTKFKKKLSEVNIVK